jgi:DNA topoisomerase IA
MKLMIVESPNKTKKIQRTLGAGWEVIASVGHVRDLPTKEMAVDLQTFEPTFIDSLGGGNFVKWNLEDRCSHFNPGYNLLGLTPV